MKYLLWLDQVVGSMYSFYKLFDATVYRTICNTIQNQNMRIFQTTELKDLILNSLRAY